jgi:quercetin dioxygenase-like cupin family protein
MSRPHLDALAFFFLTRQIGIAMIQSSAARFMRKAMPFINTNQLTIKEPLPGWKGRFFHSQNMTFGYYSFEAGASIHEHSHPNEEVWHIIEGEVEVRIAGQMRLAGPGSVAIVPPNTAHCVKALTSGRSIVVDYPLRHSFSGINTD